MRQFLLFSYIVVTLQLTAGVRTEIAPLQPSYVPNFPELLENIDRIVISEAQGRDSYTPPKVVTDKAWITAFVMTLTASNPTPSPYCWCITNEHYSFFAGDQKVMKLMLKHKEMATVSGPSESGGQIELGQETFTTLTNLLAQKRSPPIEGRPPQVSAPSEITIPPISMEATKWNPEVKTSNPVGSFKISPILKK